MKVKVMCTRCGFSWILKYISADKFEYRKREKIPHQQCRGCGNRVKAKVL